MQTLPIPSQKTIMIFGGINGSFKRDCFSLYIGDEGKSHSWEKACSLCIPESFESISMYFLKEGKFFTVLSANGNIHSLSFITNSWTAVKCIQPPKLKDPFIEKEPK